MQQCNEDHAFITRWGKLSDWVNKWEKIKKKENALRPEAILLCNSDTLDSTSHANMNFPVTAAFHSCTLSLDIVRMEICESDIQNAYAPPH